MVALETIFDNNDRSQIDISKYDAKDLEEVNLGTKETPRMVYIGERLSPKIRQSLIDLLRKYRHVFAWSYDDIKAYKEDLFQYEIPLKLDAKPFRKKKKTNKSNLGP